MSTPESNVEPLIFAISTPSLPINLGGTSTGGHSSAGIDMIVTLTPAQLEAVRVDHHCEVSFLQEGSVAASKGLAIGAIVLRVGDVIVEKASEFRRALQDKPADVELEVVFRLRQDDLASFPSGSTSNGDASAASRKSNPPEFTLSRAVDEVHRGKCILIHCYPDTAPAYLVDRVAAQRSATVVTYDAGLPMFRRPNNADTYERMRSILCSGMWLMVLNATKSITLLQNIDALLDDLSGTNGGTVRFHSDSRIFLMVEPHPHFRRGFCGTPFS